MKEAEPSFIQYSGVWRPHFHLLLPIPTFCTIFAYDKLRLGRAFKQV